MSLQAANEGQNWMTQAATRQHMQAQTQETEQQTQQQAAQFQAMMPAIVAKSQADVATAKNDLDSAVLQQQLRGQWQGLKPQVITDIGKLNDPDNVPKQPDGTPDWSAYYNKWENVQAKYGALSQLPEGKSYYDMIESGKKNAFQLAVSHDTAQLTINRLQAMLQQKLMDAEQLQTHGANVNLQAQPAIKQAEQDQTMRNQEFTGITTQRDSLSQMGFALSQMGEDIKKEQSSPLGSGPLVGSSAMGMLRPSVRQVSTDIGDFATRIMSTVKNIRNINEFKAVTASIPKADDQPSVQNEKLAKLQAINQVLTQRNDFKEQVLRADPKLSPDQADQQATEKFPFPLSIISDQVKASPPASMSPADADALDFAKKNPKDPRSAVILQHLSTLQ